MLKFINGGYSGCIFLIEKLEQTIPTKIIFIAMLTRLLIP